MFGKGKTGQTPEPERSHDTVIGAGCRLTGDLTIRGALLILGEIEGSVHVTADLDVELGARVRGDIRAENARISGRIEGNVKVRDALELCQGAHLLGDVYARSFRIQDGAVFQGNCHMGKEIDVPSIGDRAQTGSS
jgi:cytoskeletal protein CcmA (bactofilin family)